MTCRLIRLIARMTPSPNGLKVQQAPEPIWQYAKAQRLILLFWKDARYSGSRQLAIFYIGLCYGYDPRRSAIAAGCGQSRQLQQGGRRARLVTTHGEPADRRAGTGSGPAPVSPTSARCHPHPGLRAVSAGRECGTERAGRGSPGDAGSAGATSHPARLPALPDDRGIRPPAAGTGRRDLRDPLQHGSLRHHHAGAADRRDRRRLHPQVSGHRRHPARAALSLPHHRGGLRHPSAGRAAGPDPARHRQRAAGPPSSGAPAATS